MANRRGGRRSSSWKPGFCPNPGGRPKLLANVRDLAREMTEKAIHTLVSVMDGRQSPPNARVAAAVALLDRGWGRPPSMLEVSAMEGEPSSTALDYSKLTDKELHDLERLIVKMTVNGAMTPTPTLLGRAKQ